MSENKIKFGLSKCYFAKKTSGVYGTPKAQPGAVSLSLVPQGDESIFYADNIAFYKNNVNDGYQGDLEVALFSEDFRKDILGETLDGTAKVLTEEVLDEAVEFALGFQIEGDQKATRFWIYDCTASRPEISSETKENGITVQTEKTTIKSSPTADGYTRSKTTAATPDATYNGWFDSVWMPNASTT